jgi:cytochrome c553
MNINKIALCAITFCGCVSIGNVASAAPEILGVCASCHGADGSGAGFDNVPIIAGTPAAHIEEALYAYQDGARRCAEEPVMCEMAATLSEPDIVEIAEHFSAMTRISAGEVADETLATAGKRIHAEHCAKCHVLPDDEDVENALRIPLHGQRSAYLRLAFDAYRSGARETLVPEMAVKLKLLDARDIDALINYYSSYEL